VSATIANGRFVADEIKAALTERIAALRKRRVEPCLAAVLVGDDPASHKYVSAKERTCTKLGIKGMVFRLPASTSQLELQSLIDRLNADPSVHGILVQLPLPEHLNEKAIMQRIAPAKDVDGFGPVSLGNLVLDEPGFLACTPHGVIKLLNAYNVSISGKHAVVIGRSVIVGKPLALLLLRRNATVTICHSKTAHLSDICRSADILCVAIGKPAFITADMVKDGAIVIDIGINVVTSGSLTGDVDFETVKNKASILTPVPGGVGPLTIAMLMQNTVQAAEIQTENNSYSS
jgi:methylenetetrahydrofolate dehydrogenase (NADP+)/methenyltetrahydrofolate cyclohydrolase